MNGSRRSQFSQHASVMVIDVNALTSPPPAVQVGQAVALLLGASGSGTATRIPLEGAIPPDYVVLTYGQDNQHERIWARSRQLLNTAEYHLTDDSNAGFPQHRREIR